LLPKVTELFIYIAGFIDQSSDGKDILPGTKIECPFWLAKALCSRKRRIVSVEIPKQYREGYREILKADANVVNLHKLGPHFYTFGTQLLSFDHSESTDIAKSLLQVGLYCYISSQDFQKEKKRGLKFFL
jgi:GINS complex subunit 3